MQRDIAKIEHTHNILAGVAALKSDYGLHCDEYDFVDRAVSNLKDIKHFGTTEYLAIVEVGAGGKILLPTSIDRIDAVCSEHMGRKTFPERILYDITELQIDDDYYRVADAMETLGRSAMPVGTSDPRTGTGYISYYLEDKFLLVDQSLAGTSIAIAYTGLSVDEEGFPLISRKQVNSLAASEAKTIITKAAIRGDRTKASLLEWITGVAGRLKQAASIPENITDNEMDEVLDVMTSFNRKSYKRPSRYSR